MFLFLKKKLKNLKITTLTDKNKNVLSTKLALSTARAAGAESNFYYLFGF